MTTQKTIIITWVIAIVIDILIAAWIIHTATKLFESIKPIKQSSVNVPENMIGRPHDWSYSTPEQVDENGLPMLFTN